MFTAIGRFFDLITLLINSLFGVTESATKSLDIAAAQVLHVAQSTCPEGTAIVNARQAKRMEDLAPTPPSAPAEAQPTIQ